MVFLHIHLVEPSKDNVITRHVHGNAQQIGIKGLSIQQDYTYYYNEVDHQHHDSSDNSLSIQTNRWYLNVFFWLMDRVLFSEFNIVKDLDESGTKPE